MSPTPVLILLAVATVWPFGRHRDKETGTIKDLEAAVVEIDTSAEIEGSEAKAMESYRLFLDLASEDPQLSAEAMRRLADLQLETSEAVQLQNNLQSLGAFGGTIQMYERRADIARGHFSDNADTSRAAHARTRPTAAWTTRFARSIV